MLYLTAWYNLGFVRGSFSPSPEPSCPYGAQRVQRRINNGTEWQAGQKAQGFISLTLNSTEKLSLSSLPAPPLLQLVNMHAAEPDLGFCLWVCYWILQKLSNPDRNKVKALPLYALRHKSLSRCHFLKPFVHSPGNELPQNHNKKVADLSDLQAQPVFRTEEPFLSGTNGTKAVALPTRGTCFCK